MFSLKKPDIVWRILELGVLKKETAELAVVMERIFEGTEWTPLVVKAQKPILGPGVKKGSGSQNEESEEERVSIYFVHGDEADKVRVEPRLFEANVDFQEFIAGVQAFASWFSTPRQEKNFLEDEENFFNDALRLFLTDPVKSLRVMASLHARKFVFSLRRLPEHTEEASSLFEMLYYNSAWQMAVVVPGETTFGRFTQMIETPEEGDLVDVVFFERAPEEENRRWFLPRVLFEREEWGLIKAIMNALHRRLTMRESYIRDPEESHALQNARSIVNQDPVLGLIVLAHLTGFCLEDLQDAGYDLHNMADLFNRPTLWSFFALMDMMKSISKINYAAKRR